MSEGKPPESLDGLDARLRKARAERRPPATGGTGGLPQGGLAIAFRIGVELVAALVVGVGIGLVLDRWLGTTPWFMVVFFFLGAAAGMLNVYRAAGRIGLAAGDRQGGEDRAREDEGPQTRPPGA